MNKNLIGFSLDIHNLTLKKDKPLKLGGLFFNEEIYSIVSHSDGDLIFHAISDAILSAIGENDIGYYFNEKDIKNKNLDSIEIVNFAIEKMNSFGYKLLQIDLTILSNKILIQPKKELIRNNLFNIFKINFINLKGRKEEDNTEKIKCYAFVLLEKK